MTLYIQLIVPYIAYGVNKINIKAWNTEAFNGFHSLKFMPMSTGACVCSSTICPICARPPKRHCPCRICVYVRNFEVLMLERHCVLRAHCSWRPIIHIFKVYAASSRLLFVYNRHNNNDACKYKTNIIIFFPIVTKFNIIYRRLRI